MCSECICGLDEEKEVFNDETRRWSVFALWAQFILCILIIFLPTFSRSEHIFAIFSRLLLKKTIDMLRDIYPSSEKRNEVFDNTAGKMNVFVLCV